MHSFGCGLYSQAGLLFKLIPFSDHHFLPHTIHSRNRCSGGWGSGIISDIIRITTGYVFHLNLVHSSKYWDNLIRRFFCLPISGTKPIDNGEACKPPPSGMARCWPHGIHNIHDNDKCCRISGVSAEPFVAATYSKEIEQNCTVEYFRAKKNMPTYLPRFVLNPLK